MPDRPVPFRVVSLHDPSGLTERVAADPGLIRPRFAPLADLRHGAISAYEVLVSLGDDKVAAPAEWSAELHPSVAGPFEARLLTAALAERERLPGDCALAVKLSAAGLRAPAVRAVLEGAGGLDRVAIISTADGVGADDVVREVLEVVRDAGGQVAVDETGSSYASLRHLLDIRPDWVRIGPDFVSGVDVDEAKAAVVEAINGLASRINARVAATGVRSRSELAALRRMGIPLAQGPVFGAPPAVMAGLPGRAADAIRRAAPPVQPAETVAGLIEARAPLSWSSALDEVADAFLQTPEHDVLVLVDERSRPLALADRAALLRGEPFERPVMRVTPTSPMRAVARRAAARPQLERYYPLVACDRRGVYLGLVRVAQLLDALAQD